VSGRAAFDLGSRPIAIALFVPSCGVARAAGGRLLHPWQLFSTSLPIASAASAFAAKLLHSEVWQQKFVTAVDFWV
jgi:hypothetical protein